MNFTGPKVLGGSGKWRDGKGFSEKELKKSGLWNFRGLFRYDRRRKSCHESNIRLLKKIKEAISYRPRNSDEVPLGLVLQEDYGKNDSLLETIRYLFREKEPKEGIIVVAWAVEKGVRLIKKELGKLDNNLVVFVGPSLHPHRGPSTTKEAVELLQKLSEKVYIVKNPGQTFHPKVYFFKFDNDAYLSTGSHNLTVGGLATNIEAREQVLQSQVEHSRDLTKEIKDFCGALSRKSHELGVDIDIDTLVESGDLTTEEELRKSRERAKKTKKAETESAEAQEPWYKPIPFSRPTIPIKGEGPTVTAEPSEVLFDNTILIRKVPKAGGRTSQVHFTRDIVEDYFGFTVGESRQLRFRQFRSDHLEQIENRPLVYSDVNKNPKIELRGARILSSSYPESGSRPLLVFEKVEKNLFHYMLLLPGDDGFQELTSHLDQVPRHGRALKYEITSKSDLYSIWPEYPM